MAALPDNGVHKFDLRKVRDELSLTLADEGIVMRNYMNAYTELARLFYQLGRLFHFIASDVENKIEVVEAHLKDKNGEHYQTVRGMLDFETNQGLIHDANFVSGARSILRLHRALNFVIRLIGDIQKADANAKTSTIARSAYDDTMSQYHIWVVRKAAHLAVYTLPYRAQLIEDISGHIPPNEADELMIQTVDVARKVYEKMQLFYSERGLLDLP